MLFLNEELFNNETQLSSFMAELENHIKFNIKILSMYKTILLNYTLKIATEPEEIDTNNTEQTINFLTKFKYFLSLNNKVIESAKLLQDNYNKLKVPYELSELQNFYNVYNEKSSEIESAQLELNNFFVEISEILSYKMPEQNQNEFLTNNINDNSIISEKNIQQDSKLNTLKETENIINSTNTVSNTCSEYYPENTLVISEISGTILLPYKKDNLNKFEDEVADINELIKKHYIVSIEKYKFPVLSRFREAFKLMRNIEKKSIFEAIDLGLELSFNYKLHPAIISACKDLNELDIYLDYLDNNQTDKFNCFFIKFEIAPLLN